MNFSAISNAFSKKNFWGFYHFVPKWNGFYWIDSRMCFPENFDISTVHFISKQVGEGIFYHLRTVKNGLHRFSPTNLRKFPLHPFQILCILDDFVDRVSNYKFSTRCSFHHNGCTERPYFRSVPLVRWMEYVYIEVQNHESYPLWVVVQKAQKPTNGLSL